MIIVGARRAVPSFDLENHFLAKNVKKAQLFLTQSRKARKENLSKGNPNLHQIIKLISCRGRFQTCPDLLMPP